MKVNDLTTSHVVVVTSQQEYDAVKAIFDTIYKPEDLEGFRQPKKGRFVIGLLSTKIYTDGTSGSPLFTHIPASDFITENTIP